MRIEQECGIPTVAAAGSNIVQYAIGYNFEYASGTPIRYISIPFPFAGQPKSVHKQYVESTEALSGKPMMQAIIDALTVPLTDEEKFAGPAPDTVEEPRLLPPDTAENLRRLFKDKEWTDYNPIILPTEERVAEMLRATSHPPDEVVTTVGYMGGDRKLTVEKVAINAVMAGARPEYFPLILAVSTRAPFGNSTTSMANMILVNGPIRNDLGMNSGTNALGPYNEVNSTVGRSFTLMSKTAGDLRNNVNAWESLGSNLQYNNLCFAENEEELPEGWDPLHVQMGFKPADNVVWVGTGWSYISSVGEVQQAYPANLLIRDYMRSLCATGSGATILLDPTVAALLKNVQGYQTKTEFSEWLSDNIEITADAYWGNGVISTFNAALAFQGLEPYATWKKIPGKTLIKPFNNPESINIVVVGGKIQTTWYATGFRLGRGILIDEWR
jgi:hypothetical protein